MSHTTDINRHERDGATMRYMTVVLDIDWEEFHPVEHRLATDDRITRKALHEIKLLDDGTIALLAEVEGDLDRYREIVSESPEVKRFAVSGNETGFCYSQTEPTPMSLEMLERRDRGDFLIEMPIEYTDTGSLLMTIVGEEADLMGLPALMDDIDIELISTGPYYPSPDGVFSELTDRQREVLHVAVENGYYQTPREATLADLATVLQIDPATVGKHLRSIESKVFASFGRNRGTT